MVAHLCVRSRPLRKEYYDLALKSAVPKRKCRLFEEKLFGKKEAE